MKYIMCLSLLLLYLSFFPFFYFFTSWCKERKLPNVHIRIRFSCNSNFPWLGNLLVYAAASLSFIFLSTTTVYSILLMYFPSFVFPPKQFIQFFLCSFRLSFSFPSKALFSSSYVPPTFHLFFCQNTLFFMFIP